MENQPLITEEKEAPRKKPRRFFLNAVIYLAIVLGLVLGMPRFLSWALHTPYPMAAITSGSMWPVLKEGDLVFIQGILKEEIEVGDVIVYQNGARGGFTIHRVVELNETTLVTKGDANFTEDAPVEYENVVGRTLSLFGKYVRIPRLGSITVFANNLRK